MKVPLHNLAGGKIKVEQIDHPNPYNFNKIHRHSYYEIILFEQGGGHQIIDFQREELTDRSCYVVGPGQVHLMQRHPESKGLVIQFSPIYSHGTKLLTPPLLNTVELSGFDFVYKKGLELQEAIQDKSKYTSEMVKLIHHLFLLAVDKNMQQPTEKVVTEWQEFLTLLESNFTEIKKVEDYSQLLGVSPKTLNNYAKKYQGTSCLQVIHQRLLLEIKRKMLFELETSKSITFDLGFSSLSSFSSFVKTKTGSSPKELRKQLTSIYE